MHARPGRSRNCYVLGGGSGPARTWDLLRSAWKDSFQSIDHRLQQYGPLRPHRFSLQEANHRLAKLMERGRWRA